MTSRGFVQVARQVMQRVEALKNPNSVVLYYVLYRLAQFKQPRRGRLKSSFGELAAEIGWSRSTLERALKPLEDEGLVNVERASNQFTDSEFLVLDYFNSSKKIGASPPNSATREDSVAQYKSATNEAEPEDPADRNSATGTEVAPRECAMTEEVAHCESATGIRRAHCNPAQASAQANQVIPRNESELGAANNVEEIRNNGTNGERENRSDGVASERVSQIYKNPTPTPSTLSTSSTSSTLPHNGDDGDSVYSVDNVSPAAGTLMRETDSQRLRIGFSLLCRKSEKRRDPWVEKIARIARERGHRTLGNYLAAHVIQYEGKEPHWFEDMYKFCSTVGYDLDIDSPDVTEQFARELANAWNRVDVNLLPWKKISIVIDCCKKKGVLWPHDFQELKDLLVHRLTDDTEGEALRTEEEVLAYQDGRLKEYRQAEFEFKAGNGLRPPILEEYYQKWKMRWEHEQES